MRKSLTFSKLQYLLLYVLLVVGFSVRTLGINWDRGHHLHPDERFLTMVTQAVSWPASFNDYLNPKISLFNPRNAGFDFFVYGTLPLKIVKIASDSISFDAFDYNNVTLVGRFLSALFDTGVLLLVFLIARKIFSSKIGLIASFIYAGTVLPIQLSHFYTVDTFLVFFLTLSFYLFLKFLYDDRTKTKILYSSLTGITLGLALASKISALLFLPILACGYLLDFIRKILHKKFSFDSLIHSGIYFFLFLLLGYVSFRLTNPENFNVDLFDLSFNETFLANLSTLKSFNDPEGFFPPGIQWINTKPLTFALGNNLLWGLGLPLGLLTLLSLLLFLIKCLKKLRRFDFPISLKNPQAGITLILLWILFLFGYQSIQFSKNLRYFYPIYPFIAILVGYFISRSRSYLKLTILYLLLVLWPTAFLSIYTHPHSRITASEWIYKNIPPGAVISCEHWDDCLPLSIGNQSLYHYKVETLELFNPDTPEKWNKLNWQLRHIDYLILSSNRLSGSIPQVPKKYPLASKFYEDLFTENLAFKKVAEFTSYPQIAISKWRFEIPDQMAEESFTVYDHPKVVIFRRK